MPKISYQEIVTEDVSESGAVTHEWELSSDKRELIHFVDGKFEFLYIGSEAKHMWSQLCRSK